MKKLFENFWYIIAIVMIVGGVVISFWEMFSGIWNIILDIGDGSWVKGIIFLPFSIFGSIQIIRGSCAVFKNDLPSYAPSSRIPTKDTILSILYLVVTITSYIILFIVI